MRAPTCATPSFWRRRRRLRFTFEQFRDVSTVRNAWRSSQLKSRSDALRSLIWSFRNSNDRPNERSKVANSERRPRFAHSSHTPWVGHLPTLPSTFSKFPIGVLSLNGLEHVRRNDST